MIDRAGLADFLRRRREALQPEDVGLPRGQRRRTSGLRREEVAALCHMSTDYYSPAGAGARAAAVGADDRLDRAGPAPVARRARPPVPSRRPPAARRGRDSEHISPGMLRIFDRLADTPAEIVTELGETLRQTPWASRSPATLRGTPARPAASATGGSPTRRPAPCYPPRGPRVPLPHVRLGAPRRAHPAGPRLAGRAARRAPARRSEEFRALWQAHEVGIRPREVKRFVHPQLGRLELTCQVVLDPRSRTRCSSTPRRPASESYEKLSCSVRRRAHGLTPPGRQSGLRRRQLARREPGSTPPACRSAGRPALPRLPGTSPFRHRGWAREPKCSGTHPWTPRRPITTTSEAAPAVVDEDVGGPLVPHLDLDLDLGLRAADLGHGRAEPLLLLVGATRQPPGRRRDVVVGGVEAPRVDDPQE